MIKIQESFIILIIWMTIQTQVLHITIKNVNPLSDNMIFLTVTLYLYIYMDILLSMWGQNDLNCPIYS